MALRTPAFNDAKTYGFEWIRAGAIEAMLQEGVLNFGGAGTDFKATAAAGGGLKVDVAAGAAVVKGDSGVPATGLTQGLFFATNDAAILNAATLGAAHATLPRIDQILLRVRDSSDLGTLADDATIIVAAGAATSGATLDNRNGAAALPNDCIRLADVLVPANAVNVIAGNVRDRRPWARGFMAAASHGSGSTYAASSWAQMDSLLQVRAECSGAPLTISVQTSARVSAVFAYLGFWMDGAPYGGFVKLVNTTVVPVEAVTVTAPAAGSHLIGAAWITSGGATVTLDDTVAASTLVVREDPRQLANNGIV